MDDGAETGGTRWVGSWVSGIKASFE